MADETTNPAPGSVGDNPNEPRPPRPETTTTTRTSKKGAKAKDVDTPADEEGADVVLVEFSSLNQDGERVKTRQYIGRELVEAELEKPERKKGQETEPGKFRNPYWVGAKIV